MSEGVTASERYLARLCRRSFLKLWSWPNLHKDQGGGKEICDLLVVFDKHLLIFSDKLCEFPDTGDIKVDWARWYRRAIESSAKQIWGAERWLLNHPDRVFLDPKCTKPFPLDLPAKDEAIVHRIAVAHGARQRCKKFLGGSSGSLIIRSQQHQGDDHFDPQLGNWEPFTVGQVDPTKGFVHVLDDDSLDIVLKELDTITDLLHYLDKRKELLTTERCVSFPGEEEALANYILHTGPDDDRCFKTPPGDEPFMFEQGIWHGYENSEEKLAKLEADQISYNIWDTLIDKIATHAADGTRLFAMTSKLSDTERSLRQMAREPRVRRRILAKSLFQTMKRGRHTDEALEAIIPSHPDDPLYVFLTLDPDLAVFTSREDYQKARRELLIERCMIKKLDFPNVPYIVGLATEPLNDGPTATEDFCVLDLSRWTDQDEKNALFLRDATNKPYSSNQSMVTEYEFPPGRKES